MREAVIIEGVRSPVGRRGGALSGVQPADLAATVLKTLVDRSGVDPELVEDVILGCVHQVGEQSLNIARNAALGAGLPLTVPGTTVDRQCGSGQQALHFGAQGVMAGAYDAVVVGGVESLSRVPMLSNAEHGPGRPYGDAMRARFGITESWVDQGLSAEMIAEKWGIDREACDRFSVESHRRAAQATGEGRFEREIVPIEVPDGQVVTTDEGVRPGTTVEKLSTLRPVFKEDGVVTAAGSSQISDGAAALLVTSAEFAERHGLEPRAVVKQFALAGDDPIIMLTAVIPATLKLLERAGLGVDDVDLFEINEAFAPVVLAWLAETGADPERVNVNGGAIALGHPVGCTGGRLMVTMLHELERSGQRVGVQAMCEGGGLANATMIERV